jgi:hypothetical protein
MYICKKITMKRTIMFSTAIVSGYDKQVVVDIIPKIEDHFQQRKTYNEYYFRDTIIDLDLETLDLLSNEYKITLSYEDLIIYT